MFAVRSRREWRCATQRRPVRVCGVLAGVGGVSLALVRALAQSATSFRSQDAATQTAAGANFSIRQKRTRMTSGRKLTERERTYILQLVGRQTVSGKWQLTVTQVAREAGVREAVVRQVIRETAVGKLERQLWEDEI